MRYEPENSPRPPENHAEFLGVPFVPPAPTNVSPHEATTSQRYENNHTLFIGELHPNGLTGKAGTRYAKNNDGTVNHNLQER